MAALAPVNTQPVHVDPPEGGWTREIMEALIGPDPVVKALETLAGRFLFVTSKADDCPNLLAAMETRTMLRGTVLVIPPGEVVVRSNPDA